MNTSPGYNEVADFAETNIAHPQRVIIAYHIRSGQYEAALKLLSEESVPAQSGENEAVVRTGVAELQMMIEHLRMLETPQGEKPQF